MSGLKQVTRVILLSLLAGSACSASEEVDNTNAMQKEEVSLQPLHAGIEFANAGAAGAESKQMMVVFQVSNSAEQPVKVLKWNTPFEKELSADVFAVMLNGQSVEYQGRMVKRGAPQESDFIDVPAGGSIDAIVDIGRYYDISEPGVYTLSYKPYVVDGVVQLNQETPVTMDADTLTFTVPE